MPQSHTDGSVFDNTSVVRVFALVCQSSLKELGRAAHASLKAQIVGVYVQNLQQISGAHYFQLREFHAKMVSAALNSLNNVRGFYG